MSAVLKLAIKLNHLLTHSINHDAIISLECINKICAIAIFYILYPIVRLDVH